MTIKSKWSVLINFFDDFSDNILANKKQAALIEGLNGKNSKNSVEFSPRTDYFTK